ncbi:MAG: hypothetical protein MUC95_00680, partial [Spirochaetes bacterium]|nr:hypothetical protein [Spirochaetota bacterium]
KTRKNACPHTHTFNYVYLALEFLYSTGPRSYTSISSASDVYWDLGTSPDRFVRTVSGTNYIVDAGTGYSALADVPVPTSITSTYASIVAGHFYVVKTQEGNYGIMKVTSMSENNSAAVQYIYVSKDYD